MPTDLASTDSVSSQSASDDFGAASIIAAGPMTLIQDLGRLNVAHLGLAQGGALDEHSYLWANKLLDNEAQDAQIEVNIGPLELRFNKKTTIAITGADMGASINGHSISNWSSHRIKPGDKLKLRGAKSGLRAYVAIQGGWQVPQFFGSRSSVPRELIGHFVKAGVALPYIVHTQHLVQQRLVPKQYQGQYLTTSKEQPCFIKLIPGYQFKHFDPCAIEHLLNQSYRLSAHCDRMGFRLLGLPINSSSNAFQSEGIALGSVQIPTDGQPIILHKDRQSIGGYPKVGCVSLLDLNKLAQLRPGSYIQFSLSSLNDEMAKRSVFLEFFGLEV